MWYIDQKECVIIKKHSIMIFYNIAKFFFLMLITSLLFSVSYYYKESFGNDIIHYFLLPSTLALVNYAFFKFIFALVYYYNDLVIFIKDKIIVIKSTLFLQDDLEIVDISKVMKIDVQCHWFLANFIGYGNLVIEQQNQVRTLHFVPKPYKALELLREKTTYLHIKEWNDFFKSQWESIIIK